MNKTQRSRPLAFEQMEQRLALSAASVGSFDSMLSPQWQLTTNVGGGVISFDQLYTSDVYVLSGLSADYDATGLKVDRGFIDIVNGEPLFSGPVFSRPEVEGTTKSNEAGGSVTPIPQPQIGHGEVAQGLIAVAEIFRPTNATVSSPVGRPLVEHKAVETTVAAAHDDSWKSTSLARGRDVYFEVAALSDHADVGNRSEGANLSSKIAPLIYQQTLQRREAERAAATTSQEPLNTQRSANPLPAVPQQQSQPLDSQHPESPASAPEVEKNQRTAQDGDHPQANEVSQGTDSRDHVFAAWNDGDELSDEAIALRTENPQSRTATWPVLAALAATGWIARNRRSKGVMPSRRLPLRRTH
jgi:hypothetical protein